MPTYEEHLHGGRRKKGIELMVSNLSWSHDHQLHAMLKVQTVTTFPLYGWCSIKTLVNKYSLYLFNELDQPVLQSIISEGKRITNPVYGWTRCEWITHIRDHRVANVKLCHRMRQTRWGSCVKQENRFLFNFFTTKEKNKRKMQQVSSTYNFFSLRFVEFHFFLSRFSFAYFGGLPVVETFLF